MLAEKGAPFEFPIDFLFMRLLTLWFIALWSAIVKNGLTIGSLNIMPCHGQT
jgi:hypothetical protein